MTVIAHHIPGQMLADFSVGRLGYPFAATVAAHVSLCDDCRAEVEAHQAVGGLLLDRLAPAKVDPQARQRAMDALDRNDREAREPASSGIYPAPIVAAMNGRPPKWRPLGGGIRQQILSDDSEGSLRLLYIPPGSAVPEHGHGGLELTLVLQGSFSDSFGRFNEGDVEVAHDEIDHQPVAAEGEPCICLAATDAPLRFRSWVPRLLQPLFRI